MKRALLSAQVSTTVRPQPEESEPLPDVTPPVQPGPVSSTFPTAQPVVLSTRGRPSPTSPMAASDDNGSIEVATMIQQAFAVNHAMTEASRRDDLPVAESQSPLTVPGSERLQAEAMDLTNSIFDGTMLSSPFNTPPWPYTPDPIDKPLTSEELQRLLSSNVTLNYPRTPDAANHEPLPDPDTVPPQVATPEQADEQSHGGSIDVGSPDKETRRALDAAPQGNRELQAVPSSSGDGQLSDGESELSSSPEPLRIGHGLPSRRSARRPFSSARQVQEDSASSDEEELSNVDNEASSTRPKDPRSNRNTLRDVPTASSRKSTVIRITPPDAAADVPSSNAHNFKHKSTMEGHLTGVVNGPANMLAEPAVPVCEVASPNCEMY